jgi:hypothetical protein
MTLLWIDGFDHCTNGGDVLDKNYDGNVGSQFGTAFGRFGSKGINFTSSSYSISKNFGVNKSTIYFGVAFKKIDTGVPVYNNTTPFITFKDESDVAQVKLYTNPNYGITAYKGDDTLLGSSSDGIVFNLRWHYIEAKVTISATVGEVTVKLDETQVLNLTSQDTKNGSDYVRKIRISQIFVNDTAIDDLYIDDAQFHGNCRVRAFMPDADGNFADFTRSTGSNDYECVDETEPNDDTDYISSNTLNHKSIFGITTGVVGTVKGIQVNNYCRIDEAGTRKIKPIIRSNSTDYQGTETAAIAADYKFESEIWETDPDDSGAWDQTKLEAAEFGLEITT